MSGPKTTIIGALDLSAGSRTGTRQRIAVKAGATDVVASRSMDPKVAKCLLVSKVLVADGIMTENEHAFLEGAMKGLGLSAEERRRVISLDEWDSAEPIVAKLSEGEKREVVTMLVDAASADGRLSPLELATVKRITAALGLAD